MTYPTNNPGITKTSTSACNQTIIKNNSAIKRLASNSVAFLGVLLLTACVGKSTDNLGLTDGRLFECPASPNCVSSQMPAEDSHYIAPLLIPGDIEEKKDLLMKLIATLPRTQLIKSTDNYLLVEFKSRLMGYVDDVEFLIETEQVQVRSASRLGYSDLDANRKRIENIRQLTQF